ncbi:ABC transporter substrate-binding protein [Halorubrum ezzemoulense]|uniref:ABC transporter substrate-binding protein n=1 Tax=Halorubrum ezzemoulense TaxID=337243 RepID=A0A256JG18_HALEZ|nr:MULTISPECIES: ABC transporter substrate-binding protein [Halorubrum]MDB2224174.1 ABC transporter substrate-binding protein [Halorubrum ezzemoulense]MDB2240241.1 ABC transporter substrate-binding protein [Halorubrum ezzemoulense]MDB2247575.1 ABC transporter substrate-binding protein [Halorubrum ezzemoulense]MDB2260271.1 ABC transporter substrate-binding protein [Halorubrum ezzemoulense]MDB2263984.1 ABC transporter substrate-binding protein [Halorubrum ezzemoulense]
MYDSTRTASRRSFLAAAGGTATVGLAGCLGGGSGGLDEITVAHMPIYPDLQWYVMEGEGYFSEVDAEVTGQEFGNGPDIVQALGGSDIDIAMFGIVPAMIAIDRGIAARVTAANIREPMGIMAESSFHETFEQQGADAFAAWEEEQGEPFTFGTFPQGSVPDVLLRFWLRDVGVDLAANDSVEIIEISGASSVWQAIANDEIDGTSIMEPVPTIAQAEGSSVEMLRTAAEVLPGQPAAVTLMSDEVRDSPIAAQFLEQHVRATDFIEENPDATAGHVEEGIGMPVDRARKALDSPLSNFITDPAEITDATQVFAEFAADNGQTDEQLSNDQIFDLGVYDSL